MTYEEVLNRIEQECDICQTSNNCVEDECIWFLCKKVIGKQIPKKPIKDENKGWLIYRCPVCGKEVGRMLETLNHHCECGQVIDWR